MRYDVVVVGSGFGGSVAALRLAEKGYSVLVLEAGRRFADHELPRTSWRVGRFLWAPALGCFGIQRITLLRSAGHRVAAGRRGTSGRRRPDIGTRAGVLVLSGAGVGGGSLVYANTLYEPPDDFYADPQWSGITDWRAELAPYYTRAKQLLGVVDYPRTTRADQAMRAVADRMGAGDTFRPTPVAVYLGPPGERVADPYFGGAGPDRVGCTHCGACMTGCRVGAKNSLPKNYLWFAERAGARIRPLTTVTGLRPDPDGAGYLVDVRRTGAWLGGRDTIAADQVVLAAGALGTQRLLHAARATGALPEISARIGALTRTNSEAILGAVVPRRAARRRGLDYTEGVAITSSFHPEPGTHVEPVRYGEGSNLMGLLATVLVDGGPRRVRRWLGTLLRRPGRTLRLLSVRGWSRRAVVALVMQSVDNSLTTYHHRGRLAARHGHGEPNPSWIPAGNQAVRLLADEIGGIAAGPVSEPFGVPMTAHILGGAVIGATARDGVVDAYHRVFGCPGLHVVDGAAVPANLGVNPSLTIAALAERAMAHWPAKGEPDGRQQPEPSSGRCGDGR
ncbi:GMC family oxidoreductase [Solwaraspora sp. WMMB335]|uniref:GMC family oxidoreductase n=1 Tax=Solwaraspora sp. WMMB335 TaxID=3404118 RepID=UPI003B935AFA